MARADWLGASYTGQNRVRLPESDRVCEPCVVVHARSSPVPGRPAKPGKQPPNWRNFSVLCEVVDDRPHLATASKGDKALIRDWLRRDKRGPWFAAIADSGQKHVVPGCPMNPAGARGGRVLFEETEVRLPAPGDAEGWPLLDAMTDLLTQGASKEGIASGEHAMLLWQQMPLALEGFEARWGGLRASTWWILCLWLGQRDEARSAEIQAARRPARAQRRT